MALATGFVQDLSVSRLYLPESLVKAERAQEAEAARKERGRFMSNLDPEARRQSRGQFFSQYGKAERWNQAGAQEKPPDEPSFMYLRNMYSDSLMDQIIVMRRQQQVRSVCRRTRNPDTQLGWRVTHVDHEQPDFKETDEIKRRCRAMEDIIENGLTPEIHPGGFADFMSSAVQEELIVDRKVMVRFKDRSGYPRQYHLVDGTTIKPISKVLYEWIEEHNQDHELDHFGPSIWSVAALGLSEDLGIDLTNAAYVQEIDGAIKCAWTADQMDVDITHPSVEINRLSYGYGSCFQRSTKAAEILISLWDYNDGLLNTNYPENLLLLFGDYSPQGLEAFIRQVTSQVGKRDWSRLAVVPADQEFKADVKKIRDSPRDMMFDRMSQLLLAVKCAAYGMHPSEINVEGFGDGEGSLNEPNEETQIAERKEEGFHGLLGHAADWLNRSIVTPRDPDLRMGWVTSQKTEQARVEVNVQRTASYGTINEARTSENKPRIEEKWADQPLWAAQITMQGDQQKAQMEQQGRMQDRQMAQQQQADVDSQAAEHEHKERIAQTPKPLPAGAEEPGKPGGSRPKEKTGGGSWGGGAASGGETKAASHQVTWTWRRQPKLRTLTDGRLVVRVGGRIYTVETTPYGATYRAPSGGIILHTDRVPGSPEEAALELEGALEEARGGVPA